MLRQNMKVREAIAIIEGASLMLVQQLAQNVRRPIRMLKSPFNILLPHSYLSQRERSCRKEAIFYAGC